MKNESNSAKWLTETGQYNLNELKRMAKRLQASSQYDRRIVYELIGDYINPKDNFEPEKPLVKYAATLSVMDRQLIDSSDLYC
jgi:hypothetical protein